ncbi:hypothetical protein PF003_g13470 [Phytophthora fragariae]|nr:hypothetical protein PF003_g13470 [Phytophthora fragariae]
MATEDGDVGWLAVTRATRTAARRWRLIAAVVEVGAAAMGDTEVPEPTNASASSGVLAARATDSGTGDGRHELQAAAVLIRHIWRGLGPPSIQSAGSDAKRRARRKNVHENEIKT